MAFKLATSQVTFFEAVFGANHPVTTTVKELGTVGVVFDIGLYTCKADYKGKTYQVSLTKGTTSLIKHSVEPEFIEQNKAALQQWVTGLAKIALMPKPEVPKPKYPEPVFDDVYPPTAEPVPVAHVVPDQHIGDKTLKIMVMPGYIGNPLVAIKSVRSVTGGTLYEAKKFVEEISAGKQLELPGSFTSEEAPIAVSILTKGGLTAKIFGESKPVTMTFSSGTVTMGVGDTIPKESKSEKPKPTGDVIQLRFAKAVGQKVKGTSTGSVYYCVALNDRVKIAARIYKAGSISIRAEWQGATTQELKQLQDSGLGMKGDYASMHLNADGVPYGRVIGAFLMGTGIQWTDAVMSGADLVVVE